MFVDKAKIFIKSGKGGNGAVSFRREPYVPQGGPDGGNGGKGGDIVILADENLRTLMDFRYKTKYEAQPGEDGRKKQQYGKDADDLVIKVPVGTLVRDIDNDLIIADLKKHGQSVVAAKGGRGGRGNVLFKNSVRQAPNFAEAGGAARELNIELELKLLADVGLIGYPNVGKSTFLSVSTKANPKIADYHFTTLTPNLGVVSIYNSSFVLADIPGLIEGASNGAGLGLDFLKHIERTRILIHVIDASGCEGRDPIEDYETINAELKQYSDKLSEKPQIVAANKTDIADSDNLQKLRAYFKEKNIPYYEMCAPIKSGTDVILEKAYQMLSEIPADELIFEETGVHGIEEDPDYKEIKIDRIGNVFVLTGKQLKKIFDSTNFNDPGSTRYLYHYIENKGAIDIMKTQGLNDGDTIRIFDYELEYTDE